MAVVELSSEQAGSRPGDAKPLRLFLLVVAAATFLGISLELWFADHTQEFLQLVPFATVGLGFLSVTLVAARPGPASIWLLRLVMLAVAFVSLLGVYEHLRANYDFEREIRPNAATLEVAEQSLHGVAPALAPGSLALAALLAVGATKSHPVLGGKRHNPGAGEDAAR